MSWEAMGRTVLGLGIGLVLVGGVMLAIAKLGWPRVPGDFVVEGRRWRVTFPLASSILISVVLTVLLNLWLRFRR